jgi:hypothetical protein
VGRFTPDGVVRDLLESEFAIRVCCNSKATVPAKRFSLANLTNACGKKFAIHIFFFKLRALVKNLHSLYNSRSKQSTAN